MPRKTKEELQAIREAKAVQEAIANLPFSPLHAADAPEAYANLPREGKTGDVQRGVALAIYRDFKIVGLSGADCRAKYGGTIDATDGVNVGLSGPRRRIVLREHGLGDGVARSYDAYSDGAPRVGSSHARMHGTQAQERAAIAAQELAEQEAQAKAKAERAAKAKARRAAKAQAKADAANAANAPQEAQEEAQAQA
jgi:hypothetical protein